MMARAANPLPVAAVIRSARRLTMLACLGLSAVGLSAGTSPAYAQDAADSDSEPSFNSDGATTLIADRVEIAKDSQLIATGNVEVLQGDVRMTASKITYDENSAGLLIEGPIRITQGNESVILASSAELSTDMTDGILRSARLVLDQQMQLAATELHRVDGRYTQLYKTVASSCEVCKANPIPLWQIRAKTVVHDQQEKMLYFKNARFEVVGVPVLYLPRLRLPDPTLKRATGFLTPSYRKTNDLGYGLKVPYFITMGPSRDLTLTPYIGEGTRTLEARYRQKFVHGEISFDGAVSSDDILPDETRSYLFANGKFDLPRDFTLTFDIETTSDDDYLSDYGYSSKDRLDSALTLSRTRRDEFLRAQIIGYESLRSSEDNQTQPFFLGDLSWQKRFVPAFIGGVGTWSAQAHTHERRSNEDIIGRDVNRISGRFDWQRSWLTERGMLLTAQTRFQFDRTVVNDDSNYLDPINDFTPTGAVEMRWPLVKSTGRGSHVIEPVVQLIYSPDDGEDTPNDESTQLELDEGNIFSLSRYPAADQVERGLRANVGVTWTRFDPKGWSSSLTFGRILREKDLGQFSGYSILEGDSSDWLAAWQLKLPRNFSITNRALFDDTFDFNRHETRFDWNSRKVDLSSTYIWLAANEAEERLADTNEWRIDAQWQINQNWRTNLDWRYDLQRDRAAETRLGVRYQNECISISIAARQRYTSSTQTEPKTDFSFSVGLDGLGGSNNGGSRSARSACRG